MRLLTCGIVWASLLAFGQSTADQAKITALYRAMAERVESKGLLDDPATQAYVQSLASRLGARAGAEITARVVRDEETPLAAIFPDGRLYLSTALLRKMPSEKALLETLAHQVAHLRVALPELPVGPSGIRIVTGPGLCTRLPHALPRQPVADERAVDAYAARLLATLRGDSFDGMQRRLKGERPAPSLRR